GQLDVVEAPHIQAAADAFDLRSGWCKAKELRHSGLILSELGNRLLYSRVWKNAGISSHPLVRTDTLQVGADSHVVISVKRLQLIASNLVWLHSSVLEQDENLGGLDLGARFVENDDCRMKDGEADRVYGARNSQGAVVGMCGS